MRRRLAGEKEVSFSRLRWRRNGGGETFRLVLTRHSSALCVALYVDSSSGGRGREKHTSTHTYTHTYTHAPLSVFVGT